MRIKIAMKAIHTYHTAGRDRYYETSSWSEYTYQCIEVDETEILPNGWKDLLLVYKATHADESDQIIEQQSDYFFDFSFSNNSQPELKEKIIKAFEIRLNEKYKMSEIYYYTCKLLLSRIAKEYVNTNHYKASIMTNFFFFKTGVSSYDAGKAAALNIDLRTAKNIAQACKALSEGVSLILPKNK